MNIILCNYNRFCSTLLLIWIFSIANAQSEIYTTAVSWSDSGVFIAAAGIQNRGEHGYVAIYNGLTGQTLFRNETGASGYSSLAWSPDDRYLALGGYDTTIQIIDARTGTLITTLHGHEDTVTWLDWSSDGNQLASTGATDETTTIWDTRAFQIAQRIHTSDAWAVEFSPNGQYLAIGALAGLFIVPVTETVETDQELLTYRVDTKYIGSVSWHPDSRLVALGSQTFNVPAAQINVIDVETRMLIREIPTGDEGIYGLSWSADGKLLASHSIDGLIKIWDTDTGALSESHLGSTSYSTELSFSPFGGRLAYGLTVSAEQAARSTTLADSGVAVVVPAPSLERLNRIAQGCISEAGQRGLTAVNQTGQLPDYIAQVEALSDEQIPPGCRADVLAVANALHSQ